MASLHKTVVLHCLDPHLEYMSGPHGGRIVGTFMMTVSQDDEPENVSTMGQRLSRVGVSQPALPAIIQNLLGPEISSDGLQFSTGCDILPSCYLSSVFAHSHQHKNGWFSPVVITRDDGRAKERNSLTLVLIFAPNPFSHIRALLLALYLRRDWKRVLCSLVRAYFAI